MAARGYAVASISYHLTWKNIGVGCNTKYEDKIKAFDDFSEDINFAVKQIPSKKKRFKVDISKIILVGTSTGAEDALNFVYVHKTKILPACFKFAGVISREGAIIFTDAITEAKAIPTQLFHRTDDRVVPYNIAIHHYCKTNSHGYLVRYGYKAIANKFKLLPQFFYLYTIDKVIIVRLVNQYIPEILAFFII